jgi:hypothetical protein
VGGQVIKAAPKLRRHALQGRARGGGGPGGGLLVCVAQDGGGTVGQAGDGGEQDFSGVGAERAVNVEEFFFSK